MDYLCWSRHLRNMPGQGDLPIVEFVEAMHRTRLRRLLVTRNLQRPISGELRDRRRRRRAALAAASSRPSRASSAAPIKAPMPPRAMSAASNSSSLPPTRRRPRRSGSCFGARLHADGDASEQRRHALAAGRHQLRDELRAGRLRARYDAMHGASVCALGLRVEDVAAALDRAEHLQIPRFTQAVGPRRDAHSRPSTVSAVA